MVYDPIRDCEVPSPATDLPQYSEAWRRDSHATPDGTASDERRNGHHHPLPPGWQGDAFHPYPPSRPNLPRSGSSSSGLRSLLNDDPSPDEGTRRSSGKSNWSPFDEDARPSISRILNDRQSPSSAAISKSNSATSLTHSASPPAQASPRQRGYHLNPSGFLTPATPAVVPQQRRASSRSPFPPSPATSNTPLPPDGYAYYADHPHAGPSSRRTSTASNNAAMPPPILPPRSESFDQSGRVISGGQLSLRSPSVSVSPRSSFAHLPPQSQHQQTPYNGGGGSGSRPGSATSASHPFSFHPGAPHLSYPPPAGASPTTSTRRLSEDPHASAPSSSGGPRHPPPHRRSSQFSAHSTPVRSPSPIPLPPYAPNRISRPNRSLFEPILPSEIAQFKALGQANNPLRKNNPRKPAPLWSGTTPRPQPTPTEARDSYFPPDEASAESSEMRKHGATKRRESVASASGRPSVTLGSGKAITVSPTDEKQRKRGRRESVDGAGASRAHLKRKSEEADGGDPQRRRVSGGNTVAVASHYNARPEVGKEGRERSVIIGLRKFNNWVKSVLIGKFAPRPAQGFGSGNGRSGAIVLDIGCGKGGDLIKWRHANLALYVGVDLAEQSIEQAYDRYHHMAGDSRGRSRMFDAKFYALDCYTYPLSQVLPDELQQKHFYDMVTMQFCMHYAFETAAKVRMMLENVTRYMKPGARFIGTVPNAEMIMNRLEEIPDDSPSYVFGNPCYSIEFTEKRHRGIYGHQYHFYLADAVDVPEYLVLWDEFVALAEEYNLKLLYKKSFYDVYQEERETRDFGPLLLRMGVLDAQGNSEMDDFQWEAANLYIAFAFENVKKG